MKAFLVEKDSNEQIKSDVKDFEKPICGENEILIKVN